MTQRKNAPAIEDDWKHRLVVIAALVLVAVWLAPAFWDAGKRIYRDVTDPGWMSRPHK